MTPRRVRIIITAKTDASLKRLRRIQPKIVDNVDPVVFTVERVQAVAVKGK